MALPDEEGTCTADNFVPRAKVVYSGQMRHYYKASCDCGWEAKRFRVTKDRAREDFDLEHIGSSTDQEGA